MPPRIIGKLTSYAKDQTKAYSHFHRPRL